MPSLTSTQIAQRQKLIQQREFTQIFERFKNQINSIADIFIDPLNDTKLCTSPNGMSVRTYPPFEIGFPQGVGYRLMGKKDNRRVLLKQLSNDLAKIKDTLPVLEEEERRKRQEELDQLLKTEFSYIYYTGYSSDLHRQHLETQRPPEEGRPGFNALKIEKLAIEGTPVTLQQMLETLMPKCIILDELDSYLIPLEKQLQTLQKKEKEHPEQYEDVSWVAFEILDGIKNARSTFFQSASVHDGLNALATTIAELYNENNKQILKTHRSHWIIQATMNVLRSFMGYMMLVLTSPGRLYDNSKVQSYVDSWFAPRETTSFRLFDAYRKTTTESLDDVLGFGL